MIIADKLKDSNQAEYLLYMWQVEDLIRAYKCDSERIANEYISRFDLTSEQRAKTIEWYSNLCEMMRSEGKFEHGHLRICMNILQNLEELHLQLIHSPKFPYYREMYYKVLPYIVELRSKQKKASDDVDSQEDSELTTCFNLLYGVMLLKLQHHNISNETALAVKDISTLVGQLSDYYLKDKAEPIDFE